MKKIGYVFRLLFLHARPMLRVSAWRYFALFTLLTAYCSPLIPSVYADSNPSNDSANITLSVTPLYDSGVEIDTGSVNLNLGVSGLGGSTQTVSPATVTIVGNLTNTELNLSAQITGGWTFDENVSASTETDKLAAWSVFKSTTSAAVPSKSASHFDNAQDSLNSKTASFGPARAGIENGDNGNDDRFEDGNVNMDGLSPGAQRHLWFYFTTPPTTSTGNEQQIRFTLSIAPGP